MKKIITLFVVCFIIHTPQAVAVIYGQGILDDVQNQFQTSALAWAKTLTARASWLFWVLGACRIIDMSV